MFKRQRDQNKGITLRIKRVLIAFRSLLLISYLLFLGLQLSAFSSTFQFVPPPMEGTISMGIYDGNGKLVRALHRAEAIESDTFGKALNGLITSWDGKDDSGTLMPAGQYYARGYGVGDLAVEGEAMHGNDFITADDSPRVKRILDLQSGPDGKIELMTQTVTEAWLILTCDKSGAVISQKPVELNGIKDLKEGQPTLSSTAAVLVRDGKIFIQSKEFKIPAFIHPIQACPDEEGGVWLIDHSDEGITDIKQFSSSGELIRRLAIPANDPIPVKISASGSELILLEENQLIQRLRELSLVTSGTVAVSGTEPAISTWKVLFSKTITRSDIQDQARSFLKFQDGKPLLSQETLMIALLPNPLLQDQPGAVEIGVGMDAEGSFLKTQGGLFLKRISSTPHLKWAVLGRQPGSKIIVLFQSDGAVIEEYHIAHPANMMAFDCGDFDFSPTKP